VGERLALPRLDDEVREPGLLRAEIPPREARLLELPEPVPGGHVLRLARFLIE
jgi:hypothetical protein